MGMMPSRLLEHMSRSNCTSSDDGDSRDPGRYLCAHATARQQCGGAFAHSALPERRVRQETVLRVPRSHPEASQPTKSADEHRRQQRGGLALEAAPQALGVGLVLSAAALATLEVREGARSQILARRLATL
jgi:hypothetical protein